MKNIIKILFNICTIFSLSAAVHAEVSFAAGRVGAMDVPAAAAFYGKALGLKEVNRLNLPDGQIEIMMNFGDSDAAAKANKNAQVIIMHRNSDSLDDPVPHLIFYVSDVKAIAAAKHWPDEAPFYVDQESPVPPGGWPKPARMAVNLPDNHLQYALTWFGCALALAIIYLRWLMRRRQRA